MGTNKARLLFEKKILLRRLVDDAESLGLTIMLCADDLSYPEVDEKIITSPDLLGNKSGALSAIQPALEYCYHAKEAWLWVMACDSLTRLSELLPLFRHTLDEENAQKPAETMMILGSMTLAGRQKTLPLIGLYRTELYAPMKNYLLSGERRVMTFCKSYSTREIALPETLATCCNFNTPEEYKYAKQIYMKHCT